MRLTVLGAGQVGLACALALRANRHANISILNREGVLRKTDESLLRRSPKPQDDAETKDSLLDGIHLGQLSSSAHALAGRGTSEDGKGPHGAFLCTPVTALLRDDVPAPPSGDAARRAERCSAEHTAPVLAWLEAMAGVHQPTTHDSACRSFIVSFARGLSADGDTAAELLSAACHSHAASAQRTAPLLYVATGPIFPKEWAQQCTLRAAPAPSHAASAGGTAAPTQHSDKAEPLKLPHLYSGTAFTLALRSHGAPVDAGLHDAMEQLLVTELFGRESVTYDRAPHTAEVLDLVNGCLPLCAFGAGMVSNAFVGSSVSALAAYSQHALEATAALVNSLVPGRARGTPLPSGACVALFSACNVFAAKEFILGRQLDYQFRQLDAARAVFPGGTHRVFAATVDGLHTRMQRTSVSSPFYEVLMDAFSTVLRASVAGEGLVKEGVYNYRDVQPTPLLQHILRVDETLLSGDERAFESAKKDMEKLFSFYPVRGAAQTQPTSPRRC